MSPITIVLLVIAVILLVAVIVLYILGRRMQKKQEEQQEVIDRTAQTVSMLIIDKKRLRLKKSGLPEEVINQTPFYLRNSKMPIVKAKVGPRMVTLICAPDVYDMIPVKKEVKASVSGMYISSVKGAHGKIDMPQKKKGFMARLREKAGM